MATILTSLSVFKKRKKKKIRYSAEHYRRVTFLVACINFKTCKQNAMLLLYGYIREKTTHLPLYKYIPHDIVHLIYNTCYREKKFHEGNTHNYWDDKSIGKLNKSTEHYEGATFELNESKTIFKMTQNNELSNSRTIVAITRITDERIRKVWRLKVLSTCTTCMTEGVEIGISIKEYNTYTNIRGIARQFELIYVEDNNIIEGGRSCVKSGDIITILFINQHNGNKFTRYAINDIAFPVREIQSDEMQLSRRRYRLAVTVTNQIAIEMLN